jgi:hypothetical protein
LGEQEDVPESKREGPKVSQSTEPLLEVDVTQEAISELNESAHSIKVHTGNSVELLNEGTVNFDFCDGFIMCVFIAEDRSPEIILDEVILLGGPFLGTQKWEGGAVGPDGALYCAPQQATTVLRISTPCKKKA